MSKIIETSKYAAGDDVAFRKSIETKMLAMYESIEEREGVDLKHDPSLK